MVESNCCQDKLSQCKIGGPSKPFIDQNLQIQLPNWDSQQQQLQPSHSPIYSHYVGSSPSSYFSSQINEVELRNAMTEAERSYQAWKKMQQKLREAAQVLS
jgi:hypothetical protein